MMNYCSKYVPAGLLMCLLFGALGCTDDRGEITVPDAESLYFEPFGLGQNAQVQDTTVLVFRDSLAWVQGSTAFPTIEPYKALDFNQSMIVVVAVPQRSGGFSIEVESVDRYSDHIEVSFLINEPGVDCLAIAALTFPFQAIAVRKAEGPITHTTRTDTYPCTV